jgi:hypothetical protein
MANSGLPNGNTRKRVTEYHEGPLVKFHKDPFLQIALTPPYTSGKLHKLRHQDN